MTDSDDEPDLFADQEPPPPEPAKVPRCIECKLPMDSRHENDPEVCRNGRAWWLKERARFEALDWT